MATISPRSLLLLTPLLWACTGGDKGGDGGADTAPSSDETPTASDNAITELDLQDINGQSARYGEMVSPRDYLGDTVVMMAICLSCAYGDLRSLTANVEATRAEVDALGLDRDVQWIFVEIFSIEQEAGYIPYDETNLGATDAPCLAHSTEQWDWPPDFWDIWGITQGDDDGYAGWVLDPHNEETWRLPFLAYELGDPSVRDSLIEAITAASE